MEDKILIHHGIMGQHWGKRNGPPYPLGYSAHTAEQKKKNSKGDLDNYEQLSKKDTKKIKKNIDKIAKASKKSPGYRYSIDVVNNEDFREYAKKRFNIDYETDQVKDYNKSKKDIYARYDDYYRHEKKVDDLARKYGTEMYKEEIKKNPKRYSDLSERDKQKILEYYIYNDGFEKAEKELKREPWENIYNDEKEFNRKYTKKLIGELSNTPVPKISEKYNVVTYGDLVGTLLEEYTHY